MFGLHVCMCTTCMPGQKSTLDPLELELSMAVNHLVGAETEPRSSTGANALNC